MLRLAWYEGSAHCSLCVVDVSRVVGRPRRACNRCELIGRKKACAVSEGICILLSRLLPVPGLLAIWLELAMELTAVGPLLGSSPDDCAGCDERPVCDCELSPSSEVMSVNREEEIPLTDGG